MFKFYCLTLGTESPSGITWDLSLKEYFWEYDLDENPMYIMKGEADILLKRFDIGNIVGKIMKFEIVDNQVWCYVKQIGTQLPLDVFVDHTRIILGVLTSDWNSINEFDKLKRHVNKINSISGGFIEPLDDIYKEFIESNTVCS